MGARYIVHILGTGEVEATLLGPAPSQELPEGTGEQLVIARYRFEYDGREYVVEQPAIVRRVG